MAQSSAETGDRIADAHARLLHDSSLQFTFADPPKAAGPPPAWIETLGHWLQAAAPAMKYVFWGGLILVGLLIAAFVIREIAALRWSRKPRSAKAVAGTAHWRPEPQQARALIQDADHLAAQGLFAPAAHLLLLRTIADIQAKRPDLVRPALTSRDIGALSALPPSGRPAFQLIAQVVERSLFGGREVDADAFRRCRAAYEEFALPKVWT